MIPIFPGSTVQGNPLSIHGMLIPALISKHQLLAINLLRSPELLLGDVQH